MKNWVALIMALTVMFLLVPGAVLPWFGDRTMPSGQEEFQIWRDILMVLTGTLAGYIGNKYCRFTHMGKIAGNRSLI